MPTAAVEKKLVYRVTKEHDPVAYGELYDRYVEKIYRFIFFKVSTKEEAEDLASEVFLKTWHYLTGKDGRDVSSFSGLIYRVARTCIIDFYRERSRRAEHPLDLAEAYGADEKRYHLVAVEQETLHILKILKKMKQEYQEVLIFKYLEDLSVREIGEILGKSAVNVRVTLHRALKIAKQLLDKEGHL